MPFLQQGGATQTFPNSATNWWSGVQIPETMRDHSHSNYLHLGFMHSITLRQRSLVLSSTWVWRGNLETISKCQASKMSTSFHISSGWTWMSSVYWRPPCFFLFYILFYPVYSVWVWACHRARIGNAFFFGSPKKDPEWTEHHQLCSSAVDLLDFQESLFHSHFPSIRHLYCNILGYS